MEMLRPSLVLIFASIVFQPPILTAAPEACEVSAARAGELPGGKEADGIIGDFILRNDRVEAVVSGNLPDRRANMTTFYGENGMTPGCLYDLTLKGAGNDHLTIFCPAGQRGAVSWVRVVRDGSDGTAEVECVTTAPSHGGIYQRQSWVLRDGMNGIEVTTLLRNETAQSAHLELDDVFKTFPGHGECQGVSWLDVVDPADKAGYAIVASRGGIDLAAGAEHRITRTLICGSSPAEAVGGVLSAIAPCGTLELTLKDPSGSPAESAVAWVTLGGSPEMPAYPDAFGKIVLKAPAGPVGVRIADTGRAPASFTLAMDADGVVKRDLVLSTQAALTFDITGSDGTPLPCKVMLAPLGKTAPADLGPVQRAHGCKDQYHSATGRFRMAVPPGEWRVTIGHGPEFSHVVKDITVAPGATVPVEGVLQRQVDTTGYISADFHNHSTASGDNVCGTPDRIVNLAAEHIEFAPTTEHNRLYDWEPFIKKLGLSPFLSTVAGVELTGPSEHLNAFPFTPHFHTQDNGAPHHHNDPRICALTLREWQGREPDRWVQVNHPRLERVFSDRDGDGTPDGGFAGSNQFVDAWEVINFLDKGIFEEAPFRITASQPGFPRQVEFVREFIWLQLLNTGNRMRAVAVADAHDVYTNGVGAWRTWLPSPVDDPAAIDWRGPVREAKAGHTILSTGPFLTVKANGKFLPGDDLLAMDRKVELKVKVQCPDWMDIDRVQVFVNSRPLPELNFTRASHPDWFGSGVVKFDRVIPVTLTQDAHLIVAVLDSNGSLAPSYGTAPPSALRPTAFHNPIYVDIDGNGFQANGDTLGFDIPPGKMPVDAAQRILSEVKR
jgi:hypothetical protein